MRSPFWIVASAMPAARLVPEMMLPPLQRLLRPLVRLMIRCGVLLPAACDMLRALYLEVAEEELGPERRTDSRISLLTGIHRKEIKRQRELPPDAPPPPLVTRNAQLIATWLGAPGLATQAGEPLPLPRSAADGPSFETLVTSVTRDVRPRAVLDDWLAQGIVTLDADDRVVLSTEAFLPQPGRDEQLFYFARNIQDHIAAAAANVLAQGPPPFIDRSVHYDRLTVDDAATLEQVGRAAAQRILLEFNRRALALAPDQAPAGVPTRRVNLGVYLFIEDEPQT